MRWVLNEWNHKQDSNRGILTLRKTSAWSCQEAFPGTFRRNVFLSVTNFHFPEIPELNWLKKKKEKQTLKLKIETPKTTVSGAALSITFSQFREDPSLKLYLYVLKCFKLRFLIEFQKLINMPIYHMTSKVTPPLFQNTSPHEHPTKNVRNVNA